MDRHVRWLRRRIITSVATQTAATFAVVAIVLFIILRLATGAGLFGVLFASVVIAQIVTLGRLALSMRSNPLNYSFMKKSVEEPFTHQVSRFQGVEVAHAVAAQLPGFAPVATIRDAHGNSGPIFDVYHDPSLLVAASVSRSGALSLLSSLKGGRVLVTSAAGLPPHERRVMNVAAEDSVDAIIASHRVALSKQGDVTKLDESAHQVVLDSLALEYASYSQLGPALSSFLDLESSARSWRVTVPVDADELAALPERLGSSSLETQTPDPSTNAAEIDEIRDVTRITYAATQPDAPQVTQVVDTDTGEAIEIPEVIAPQIAPEDAVASASVEVPSSEALSSDVSSVVVPSSSETAASETVASDIASSGVVDATTAAVGAEEPPHSPHTIDGILSGGTDPVASVPEASGVQTAEEPEASASDPKVSSSNTESVETSTAAAVSAVSAADASDTALKIAPTPFVTAEPDTIDDRDSAEPITAEVPAVVFTDAPVSEEHSGEVAAQATPAEATETEDGDQNDEADEATSDAGFAALPAALGGSVDKATLTARQAPVNSPQLVNRVLSSLRSLGGKGDKTEAADEEDVRPGSLAEAIVPAPDNAVALTGETVEAGASSAAASSVSASSVPASSAAASSVPASGAVASGVPASSAAASSVPASGVPASSSAASSAVASGVPASSSAASSAAASSAAASSVPASAPESMASSVVSAVATQTTQATIVTATGTSLTDPTSAPAATTEASAPLPVARHEVPELLAATTRRPKLSAMLKATQPEATSASAPTAKRNRRKKR